MIDHVIVPQVVRLFALVTAASVNDQVAAGALISYVRAGLINTDVLSMSRVSVRQGSTIDRVYEADSWEQPTWAVTVTV